MVWHREQHFSVWNQNYLLQCQQSKSWSRSLQWLSVNTVTDVLELKKYSPFPGITLIMWLPLWFCSWISALFWIKQKASEITSELNMQIHMCSIRCDFPQAVNCLASECIPTGNIPVPWGHKCDVIYWGSPSICDTGFAISWERQVGPIRMIRPGVIELAVVRIDTSDEWNSVLLHDNQGIRCKAIARLCPMACGVQNEKRTHLTKTCSCHN